MARNMKGYQCETLATIQDKLTFGVASQSHCKLLIDEFQESKNVASENQQLKTFEFL